MNFKTQNRLFSLFVWSLAALLLLLASASCAAVKQLVSSPPQGCFAVYGAGLDKRPTLFVAWNADLFVAWANEAGVASLRDDETKVPIYARELVANESVARLRSDDLEWKGAFGDPLPSWSRDAFSDAEISSWGLTFVQE